MSALFEFLLRQGDTTLVLGHRLSEWCGHAPVLEEDIALANTALDLIGQTRMWLGYAAEIEDKGRSADDLAFLRDAWDFRNLLMVERPNGDFAQTMMRQYLFDVYHFLWLQALQDGQDGRVGEIASKASKEASYHLERSRSVVIMLGDGTGESNARAQTALVQLWPFAGEMFVDDAIDETMFQNGIAPAPSSVRAAWNEDVMATLREASLEMPKDEFAHTGGKSGVRHTEHLGHMLATMQVLQRSYPGAAW